MSPRPHPARARSLPRPFAGGLALSLSLSLSLSLLGLAARLAAIEPDFTPTSEQRAHWAFQPMARPAVPSPSLRSAPTPAHPIDAFLQSPLEQAGLTPNPEADRVTLLRRVSLDLTGLPPAPDELEDFLADPRPDAYERVVDRLLSSPQHGERWARHWLDVARYAESEGFKADETRPNAWRYRDYVIRAFNADKPYDRFVQEQIAGDELWPDDPDALVATGFNRHYPDESNARNLVQRRQEILNDITDTVGYAFTGLSYACARCHDHKWDPISQVDYYRLQAFFANAAAHDDLVLAAAPVRADYERRYAEWDRATRALREELACVETPGREAILRDYTEKYPAEIQDMLAKRPAERSPFERQMVAKAQLYIDPRSHQYLAPSEAVGARFKGDDKIRWTELRAAIAAFDHLRPAELPIATGITDLGPDCPPTRLLRRGNWNMPEHEVTPGFLSLLERTPDPVAPRPLAGRTSGRRAALARILTDPESPLTARVLVNRLWQHHFGQGLVETPNDFGLRGGRPSHPELLDWLARDFIAHGWSLKHVHRRIVTSAAYRRSSALRPELAARDPDQRLLSRFPRRRLEGEAIRDAMLHVAGRLNPRQGGPSIFPELPPGMQSRGGWKPSADALERDRRSIYVFVRRNTRYPMFEAFDMPDTHESCGRRNTTTSPVQALSLLNNQLTLDWAQSFARRVAAIAGDQPLARIETAWKLAFSRRPHPDEASLALHFLDQQNRTDDALADLCHALLNANEFVYLN